MAVGFIRSAEAHTGTTGSTSEKSFSFAVGQAGDVPKGVLVFTFVVGVFDYNQVTGVTYGGSALAAVPGAFAHDTSGEYGHVQAWFLGSSVPSGAQNVVVSRNNNSTILTATGIIVSGDGDTAVYESGIVLLENDGAFAEQSVTDGSPGTNSMRFAAGYQGSNVPPSAGASSTLLHDIDLGTYGCATVRETTAGQGSRSVGMTSSSDDRAGVHLAIYQVSSGASSRIFVPDFQGGLESNLTGGI